MAPDGCVETCSWEIWLKHILIIAKVKVVLGCILYLYIYIGNAYIDTSLYIFLKSSTGY
jgi:hypothetical protein